MPGPRPRPRPHAVRPLRRAGHGRADARPRRLRAQPPDPAHPGGAGGALSGVPGPEPHLGGARGDHQAPARQRRDARPRSTRRARRPPSRRSSSISWTRSPTTTTTSTTASRSGMITVEQHPRRRASSARPTTRSVAEGIRGRARSCATRSVRRIINRCSERPARDDARRPSRRRGVGSRRRRAPGRAAGSSATRRRWRPRCKELKEFLFTNMYRHYRVVRMGDKAGRILRDLFQSFVGEPLQLPPHYQERIERDGVHRVVCDYIAGMTDRFALDEHRKLFDPLRAGLSCRRPSRTSGRHALSIAGSCRRTRASEQRAAGPRRPCSSSRQASRGRPRWRSPTRARGSRAEHLVDRRGAGRRPSRSPARQAPAAAARARWRTGAACRSSGAEVHVAAAQGQAVGLAHRRAADDRDRHVEVAHHAPRSPRAAARPSGRSRRGRARRSRTASARPWPRRGSGRPALALEARGRARRPRPQVAKPGGYISSSGGGEEQVDAGVRAGAPGRGRGRAGSGTGPRAGPNWVGLTKTLGGDVVVLASRARDEGRVAGVQGAHGGDEADASRAGPAARPGPRRSWSRPSCADRLAPRARRLALPHAIARATR